MILGWRIVMLPGLVFLHSYLFCWLEGFSLTHSLMQEDNHLESVGIQV